MANQPAALGVGRAWELLMDRLGTATRNLARQAGTDPLSGCRTVLRWSIPSAARLATTTTQTALSATALRLIDRDGFKDVTDTCGHAVGRRAAASLRGPAGAARAQKRHGGNELVVARDVARQNDVQASADDIHGVLATPPTVQDHAVQDGAYAPLQDIAAPMRAGNRAMHRVKTKTPGRNRTEFAVRRGFEPDAGPANR